MVPPPSKKFTAFLAFSGFENELEEELRRAGAAVLARRGEIVLSEPPPRRPVWAKQEWIQPVIVKADSISRSAQALRELGAKSWAAYSFQLHRRTQLIQQNLRSARSKPLLFLDETPKEATGAWCLWGDGTLLASARTDSTFPLGEVVFKESGKPPSRAYLKLWESFTLHVGPPRKTDRVIDLGSSPGGWTWVLAGLGCETWSVDKAPLDPNTASMKNVHFMKKDVFKLKPTEVPKMDWVFSDVICAPERLADLVEEWRGALPNGGFLCTLKFKGKTDFAVQERFQDLGGRLVHLCANKHELTWIFDARR